VPHGRAALDGEFAAFQDKILALDVSLDELSVRWTTLRGETLAFGWQGPLMRNGQVEPITGFKHYDNPYCVADCPPRKWTLCMPTADCGWISARRELMVCSTEDETWIFARSFNRSMAHPSIC